MYQLLLPLILSFNSFIKNNKAATSWLLETDFHKLPDADVFLTQVLSYLFLHKFGGSVLTFDTILVKSITPLGQFVAR